MIKNMEVKIGGLSKAAYNITYKSWRVKCELASIYFVLNASASRHISASN